jgi:MFS transporter, AAHS family, 3-hydroxyphenylpropionic acid transporter
VSIRNHAAVTVGLCFLVAVLEGFDIQAMGVAAPRLAPQFALDAKQMGWVFSISNIGLVIGASLGGWLADKTGRKPVFIAAVAMFGGFTLVTALVRDYESLLAVRFCAGLGFGAALPNMMAIAAEIGRPQRAASTAAIMFCGMPVGGGMAALTTQLLPGGFDWRTLFLLGGVLPIVLIPALHWLMAETLVRGAARPGGTAAKTSVPWALFGQRRATPTLLLWLAFLPTLLILYLFLNWLPTLVIAHGLDVDTAPRTSLAFNFGSVAGALLFGWLVDRFHFRWPLTLAYLALIVTLLSLAVSSGQWSTILLSGAVGFFLLGANYALYGVAPRYYPQEIRGTGSGASIAVGRVGAIGGPLLAGLLIGGGTSATGVVQYMVPVAAIAAIAVFALSFRARLQG